MSSNLAKAFKAIKVKKVSSPYIERTRRSGQNALFPGLPQTAAPIPGQLKPPKERTKPLF